MKEQDRGTAVRRMCHPNYEGGCETRKKKYKSSVFDTGGDLDKACLSRHSRNNFATRHGALDQTRKNDICHSTLG